MGFLSRLFRRPENRNTLQDNYNRAMKSYHIEFMQEVLDRYGMEIGDDRKYYELNMRLFNMKRRRNKHGTIQ